MKTDRFVSILRADGRHTASGRDRPVLDRDCPGQSETTFALWCLKNFEILNRFHLVTTAENRYGLYVSIAYVRKSVVIFFRITRPWFERQPFQRKCLIAILS